MTDVTSVLDALIGASAEIERDLADHRGAAGTENRSGDSQYAADVWTDEVLYEALADRGAVGAYASEERPSVLDVGEGLSVATDPLDGSSNLGVNCTVGTVVGVYDAPLPATGRDLVAAAYLLLGPMTTMTVATEDGGVCRHILRNGTVIDTESVRMPRESAVLGIAGRIDEWSPALRTFVDDVRRDSKLRYTGAMVADVENVLARGGLAAYPATSSSPQGIIRLQYEANPIAYIVERAGGRSSTGGGSILDARPGELHGRIPSFFGTPSLIEDLEAALA